MIKILFVCHGNICRSPMAEFVMKDMVQKAGLADRFYIASAATKKSGAAGETLSIRRPEPSWRSMVFAVTESGRSAWSRRIMTATIS